MARPYRLQGEGLLYHITNRGDDRKKIYLSDYDYNKFLEYLKIAKEKYKFYLYAYCLMGNHYHLLIETTQPNLSRIMQYLNTSYTTYYNIKRKKYGHLFQGRYKSILVDKDAYLLELTRYIHLNPVRAKITSAPEKYKWSSYHGYINKRGDGYIDKEQISRYISMKPAKYHQFVLEGINIKDSPFKNVYAGFILGTEHFIKDILKVLKEHVEAKDFSYKKALQETIAPETIIAAIAKYYRRTSQDILKTKERPAPERKVAIHLMKRYTALTNNEIGRFFSLTYSAVSKAAKDAQSLIDKDEEVKTAAEKIISTFKA
jgi:REP element-mobilizing transposase RayT